MQNRSLITTLEKKYHDKQGQDIMRELYKYIVKNQNFNSVSAKALVKIVTHDGDDENLRKQVLSFTEIVFEDKINNKKLQEVDYYIKKSTGNTAG